MKNLINELNKEIQYAMKQVQSIEEKLQRNSENMLKIKADAKEFSEEMEKMFSDLEDFNCEYNSIKHMQELRYSMFGFQKNSEKGEMVESGNKLFAA